MRTYQTEFPDYDDEIPDLPGFVDTSWHNDSCPSIEHHLGDIRIWLGYKDPDRWEGYDKRFSVESLDGQEIVFESNAWSEVEDFIRKGW